MSGAEVMDVGRDAIWLTLQLATPILLVGLIVGVGISLMQTLTSIQEQTLTAIPKIIATFIALLFMMPFMGAAMSKFMHNIATRIAGV